MSKGWMVSGLALLLTSCTGKEEFAISAEISPTTLELGPSSYSDDPAEGEVSILNLLSTDLYVDQVKFSGAGSDLLTTLDYAPHDSMGPENNLVIGVGVIDRYADWDEGEYLATMTVELGAFEPSTTGISSGNFVTTSKTVDVQFSLQCDLDGDGFEAELTGGEDCDDTDEAVNGNAGELCDGVDNDCDGDVDESDALDAATWYDDKDKDGFGDAASATIACDQPDLSSADDSDCDDGNKNVSPAASELCDGIDNDCDGSTDENDATDAGTWYRDADGDTWGDETEATQACAAPAGFVSRAGDCDDGDDSSHTGATEVCDGADNDCDGDVDEGVCEDTAEPAP